MASRRLALLLDNIKFAHTIFALPFAYCGMLLAADGLPTLSQFLWITVAMAGARTLAMSANRLIDREIDARNRRTSGRPLVTGAVRSGEVWALMGVSLAIYLAAAASLNRLTLLLAPAALVFLIGYSYTKRFTWASHWVLGITDGAAAAGGWIAVTGRFEPGTWLLWAIVAVWIAGFDVIYACQDVEFDRREGLQSVPARFGVARALTVARVCHLLTALGLLALGLLEGMCWPYWMAWAGTSALLVHENRLVRPDDLSRLGVAFFNMNGYIAVLVLVGVLLSVYLC
ncbi:MAG: UbiA family prenyltransferase [Anaerolineae bacterium]|nr:UbiA family prenyltransferase [Anaerolineae bacterium]